jgi:hypothetical protein
MIADMKSNPPPPMKDIRKQDRCSECHDFLKTGSVWGFPCGHKLHATCKMRLDAEIEEAMGHSWMANRLMQNLNDGIGEELFAMLAEILTDLDLGMKCQVIDLLYSSAEVVEKFSMKTLLISL